VFALKKEIKTLLAKKDFAGLQKLYSLNKKVITTLISLSYDKSSNIAWRSIEAIGILSGHIAKSDSEIVRNMVGRLLWMIRDESGGIGWSVPEILGEIVRNNPELCADIAPIIASFHEEKMLTPGVLWALSRMGKLNPDTVDYAIPIIRSYIADNAIKNRCYAAKALGELGTVDDLKNLENLRTDNNNIDTYENGELVKKTVGEIAEEAIAKINK
jgi:hypothetical protein